MRRIRTYSVRTTPLFDTTLVFLAAVLAGCQRSRQHGGQVRDLVLGTEIQGTQFRTIAPIESAPFAREPSSIKCNSYRVALECNGPETGGANARWQKNFFSSCRLQLSKNYFDALAGRRNFMDGARCHQPAEGAQTLVLPIFSSSGQALLRLNSLRCDL